MEINEKTVEQVTETIRKIVCTIQQQSGRLLPPNLCDISKPIGDLTGFDSINGVEASVQIGEQLGCDIDGNPFVSKDGRRALRINEIAKELVKTMRANGVKKK